MPPINPVFRIVSALSICWLLIGCNPKNHTVQSLTTAVQMKDSVLMMTRTLSQDLHAKGPIAWLSYFEQSTQFYMASDGGLAFPDFKTADSFVRSFAKQMRTIDLNLSSVRVDSISINSVSIGATFTETLTDTSGKANAFAGYVSGLADQTKNGWQFRNIHWSIRH